MGRSINSLKIIKDKNILLAGSTLGELNLYKY
jgi:hypothetical protein